MNNVKKILEKDVWSKDHYYKVAGEASQNTNHYGMKILKKYADKSSHILDLGCGEGTRLNYLKTSQSKLTGVDISKKAIFLARKKYKDIEFIKGDLEKLPFKDHSFDLVYSAWVLEHLSNPEAMINEAIRVTNHEGVLIMIAPNFGAPNRISPPSKEQKIKKIILGWFKDLSYLFKNINHLNWYRVTPIANRSHYKIDWDTTIEPYLFSLKKYFLFKNLEIKESSSCFEEESTDAGLLQRIIRVLAKFNLFPFYYWGPHLVIIAKK